jgi:PAS domain S-box-containing protein
MQKTRENIVPPELLNLLPGRVYTLDERGYFSYWSRHSLKHLGYKTSEIIGKKHFTDLLKDKTLARQLLKNAGESGEFESSAEIIRKNGRTSFAKISLKSLKAENGRIKGYIGINHDVTLQKRLENELKTSLKNYKNLFENSSDAIYTLDLKGRFIDANKKAQQVSGFHKKNWIGKSFLPLVDGPFRDKALKILEDYGKGKLNNPQIVAIRSKNGKRILLEINNSYIKENGKVKGYQSSARDITETHTLRESLQKSEERYRSIFENANDIIYFLDEKGRFIDINRAAEKAVGISKKKVIGRHFTDVLFGSSKKETSQKFKQAMEGRHISPYQVEVVDSKGDIRKLIIRPSSITESGKTVGRFGIANDITELTRVQEELERSESALR